MSWIPVAGFLGAVTAAALVGNWTSRALWARVGAGIGLSLDGRWPALPRLTGELRGFDVVVSLSPPKIAVAALGVNPWFTLEKDSPMAQSTQPDIEVGDRGFDGVIRVRGDRDFALGLLDDQARLAAEKVVLNLDGWVADEKIVVLVKEIQSVPHVIDAVLTLAESLHRPPTEEIPSRLAKNALGDPSTGFRVRVFRHLAQEFGGAPEALSTARTLLDSTQAELRLEAAMSLVGGALSTSPDDREQALEVLRELAETSRVEDRVRSAAMDRLSRSAPPELVVSVAETILRRRKEPRDVCLAALDALVEAGAIEELLRWHPGMSFDAHPAEMEALASELGRCGDPKAQPKLLEFLEFNDVHVRIATATALGAVGDVRAVPALRRVAGEKTLVKSPLAKAVEEAVLQIQARVGGSQGGEISMVEPAVLEGAISPAENPGMQEGGEVSLADDAADAEADATADATAGGPRRS